MKDDTSLRINEDLAIPLSELRFQFSRSSGPGGQNVNRTSTRVELIFDVAHSPSLSEAQRTQISKALESHMDKEGLLHLVSQQTRSQWRNREDVIRRFQVLVQRALLPRKKRRPTRPTRASRERTLTKKRRKGETKRTRRRVHTERDE
ncbi:MAG: hypothetical protein A2Z21_05480 [Candidatus Fraserbacteria bacterium RBG_16_55_9]|uniref:Prokaryotic-type class I peptide chain release factors domain-containing protein n=1 Tax=Fraserbacteria sp. (strain RBG_16_55_9) TaxID=1817864 RepID=A0A1F5V2S5_FRAXR|nr:MAG: hypothetical protein A2Z21_05480 [Candidatus Fraserbacteria bacterium RBG_16_55_9]